MNRTGKLVVFAALALVIYSAYTVWHGAQGFNPPLIEKVKQEMRDDFARKGNTVVDVSMLRRAPRELAGSVTIKAPGSDQPQQKKCTATLAQDDTYRWSCE
ncbi:hypothetical protein ACSVBT_17900 [Afipia sp. TerB]